MTKLYDFYRCSICGQVVQIIKSGSPTLVCCGQQMEKLEFPAHQPGPATDKHVPVVTIKGNDVEVVVGSTVHPATAEHHIEWVEINADGNVMRNYLKATEEPRTVFHLSSAPSKVSAIAACNMHGVWSTED